VNVALNRILAIDDDPINRRLLEIYLWDDFTFKIVHNANQALESLEEEDFDLVVTDVNLDGGHDGIWLGRHIKAEPKYKQVPVVAFTSHVIDHMGQDKINGAFDYVIEKPVVKKQFVARLKEILHN
jgi:CheY-like chemotaxis protein